LTSANIEIGDIPSGKPMDGAVAAVRQFDPRKECRFQRTGNGEIELRIVGPGIRF
jgi:hypothetical protein